ncbi:hypothetical protein MPTK1_3g13550 [Marchantia polymorpha subsp. ruderalis]
MARFRISSAVLATIAIWLSLSMVASAAENRSHILNALTGSYTDNEVFVQCTCVYDTSRRTLTTKFLLKPGVNTSVEVDRCPGVKQVECDVTMYSSPKTEKYYMKLLVWYFTGPSQTKFRFDNSKFYFAVAPDFTWSDSGLVWSMDVEDYFTPKFLSPASENVLPKEI